MKEYPISSVNHFVLSKHHLIPETKINDIVKIARNLCGLHSTSQSTPYLSLFARTINFKKEILDEVVFEKKLMGKIRCMRKTVFVLPRKTIPFYYKATKNQYAKRHVDYLKNLGVSVTECLCSTSVRARRHPERPHLHPYACQSPPRCIFW